MEKFKFLEHTADVKFQAFGKTLEDAFGNSALAMFTVLTDITVVGAVNTKQISVKGNDLKSLLYNFLEELLFLVDSEFFLLSEVVSVKISNMDKGYILNASVKGDTKDDKYETSGDIKAITYSEMFIKEDNNGCTVQVVLDI